MVRAYIRHTWVASGSSRAIRSRSSIESVPALKSGDPLEAGGGEPLKLTLFCAALVLLLCEGLPVKKLSCKMSVKMGDLTFSVALLVGKVDVNPPMKESSEGLGDAPAEVTLSDSGTDAC